MLEWLGGVLSWVIAWWIVLTVALLVLGCAFIAVQDAASWTVRRVFRRPKAPSKTDLE